MKHRLLLLFMLLPSVLVAQNQLFGKYQTMRNVHYVCVTRTMLDALAEKQQVTIGGYSLNELRAKISNVLIIRTTDAGAMEFMSNDFEKLSRDKDYQPLLRRQDDSRLVVTLYRPDSKYDNEMVLYEQTEDYQLFIIFTGQFTAGQFAQLVQ